VIFPSSPAYDLPQMADPHDRVLLAPGHEAEWAKINEEEAREEAEFAASLSMEERVTLGQQLSQQAYSLLVASVKAGHAPERALWS
jgi:mannose/cellobiose epimerase-like protein (N-acyl-D-glucosamine 2-epimerase family)